MNVRFADCRYDLVDPPGARARYLEAHIPGAAFVDLDEDLSDLSVPAEAGGRHPLPSAERRAVVVFLLRRGPASSEAALATCCIGSRSPFAARAGRCCGVRR